jgi:hypothetical protein
MPHLQPTITFCRAHRVAVADNVFEGIAASPFPTSTPGILFHRISFGKVVPRSDELHRSSMGRCLTISILDEIRRRLLCNDDSKANNKWRNALHAKVIQVPEHISKSMLGESS